MWTCLSLKCVPYIAQRSRSYELDCDMQTGAHGQKYTPAKLMFRPKTVEDAMFLLNKFFGTASGQNWLWFPCLHSVWAPASWPVDRSIQCRRKSCRFLGRLRHAVWVHTLVYRINKNVQRLPGFTVEQRLLLNWQSKITGESKMWPQKQLLVTSESLSSPCSRTAQRWVSTDNLSLTILPLWLSG